MPDFPQTGSGLATPVALSGLPLGEMGQGGGMGQTFSQAPQGGLSGQDKGDQNQIDPLLLQAIMAQMMGGQSAGLGNLSLTQGVGGQSLGQFGVPFGGMGAPQGSMAGPGQQIGGTGTADPFTQMKSILGGISSLSRLSGGPASPTTDDQRGDTGGQSLSDQLRSGAGGIGIGDIAAPGSGMGGPGASLGSGGGTLGGQSSPLPMVGDLSPEMFSRLIQSGLTPQQISQFMGGANLATGQVSGGEMDPTAMFGGTLGAGGGGGTLGQTSGMGGPAGPMDNVGFGNIGLGGAISGAQGLFGLAQAAQGGGIIPILKSILGLGGSLANMTGLTQGLFGAANTSFGTAGGGMGDAATGSIENSMGTSLAASGVPIAAIIMNMAMTGLSAAERAQAGVSPGENAIDSLIDSMGIPGLSGVEGPLHTLFARQPSREQRDAMDLRRAGVDINQTLPGIYAAGNPQELAQSLSGLYKGAWNNQPYPILNDVAYMPQNQGLEGMRNLPDPGQEAALFGGDPSKVSFNWQQGVRQEDRDTFSNFLNTTVREQMQLFQAANAGDPMAQQILQFFQGQNQARLADIQARGNQYWDDTANANATGAVQGS